MMTAMSSALVKQQSFYLELEGSSFNFQHILYSFLHTLKKVSKHYFFLDSIKWLYFWTRPLMIVSDNSALFFFLQILVCKNGYFYDGAKIRCSEKCLVIETV